MISTEHLDKKVEESILNYLKIDYNPISYKVEFHSSFIFLGTELETTINKIITDNKRIYNWTELLFRRFSEAVNEQKFEVEISCDEFEKNEIERQIKEFRNLTDEYKKLEIIAKFKVIDSDKMFEVLSDLENFLDSSKTEVIERDFNKLKPELKRIHNHQINIAAAATMSAGKSTVLNALIGKTILPSRNEATTATICKIKVNNKLKSFQGNVIEACGKISTYENIDETWLSSFNEKANIENIEMLIEGPVFDFDTQGFDVHFIDTPGPNNSQNERHKEATYRYLKDKENKPILMYILNATQLRTDDEKNTLSEISDFLNENRNSNDRIIFILNRIDDLDPEKESLSYKIEKTKEYLKNDFGITNPRIFPLSAEYARLAIKENNGEILSRNEKSNLSKFRINFKPEGDFEGVKTYEFIPSSEVIKDNIINKLGKSELKDDLIYSGIEGLRDYLHYYIKHQHRSDVLHELYLILETLINKIYQNLSFILNPRNLQDKLSELEESKKKQANLQNSSLRKIIEKIKYIPIKDNFIRELESQIEIRKNNIIKNLKLDREVKVEESKQFITGLDRDINEMVRSIKTTFEAKSNTFIKHYVEELKRVTKEVFGEELNHETNYEALLNLEINIQIDSVDINSIINKNVQTIEEIHDNGARWYNPFSWFNSDNIKYIKIVNLNNIFIEYYDPWSKKIRQAFSASKEELIKKSESIKEIYVTVIKDKITISIDEINREFERQSNQTEMEYNKIKENLQEIENTLKIKQNKIFKL